MKTPGQKGKKLLEGYGEESWRCVRDTLNAREVERMSRVQERNEY